jgi:signal transduction histidine kinase
MKTTMSASTRDPGPGLCVGLALSLTVAAALEVAALWLALAHGSRLAAAPLTAIAGGMLACLLSGILLAAAMRRTRRLAQQAARAAAPVRAAGEGDDSTARAHARKMQALGLLAGGVAHDFNNQLQVIRNSLEILQRQGPGADTRRYLEIIRRSADRAAALTGQLLAFSRREAPEPRPLDPNDLVTQAAELLRHALGERITVETVLGQGIANVSADAGQLEAALLNLAINARDAMAHNGLLTIETANVMLEKSLRPYVMIAVSDTGSGMAPEVAARACEPFFTTKALGSGTGLGLSQVAGFVRQSGGQVRISSAPGQGTTVSLYLPRIARAPEPPARGSLAPKWSARSVKDATPDMALAAQAGAER